MDEVKKNIYWLNCYLEQDKRFALLKQNESNIFIRNYVDYLIKNVSIKLPCREYERVSKLSKNGSLLGWCFQTSVFLAPFLGSDCFVCRGNIYFHKKQYGGYYHSWLEFKIRDINYVYDPCLNYLGLKEIYDCILSTEVYKKISSTDIEKYLVDVLSNSNNDILINYKDDIDEIFYRTDASLSGVVRNGKIKSLLPKYLLRNRNGYRE